MAEIKIGPKTKAVAVGLLAAAKDLELDPKVVKSVRDGFLAPEEVVEKFQAADEEAKAKEDAEAAAKAEAEAKAAEEEKAKAEAEKAAAAKSTKKGEK